MMRILEEMLSFNHEFVKKTAKRFAHNLPSKIPSRELAIFTLRIRAASSVSPNNAAALESYPQPISLWLPRI